jgi:hypothetical protein
MSQTDQLQTFAHAAGLKASLPTLLVEVFVAR